MREGQRERERQRRRECRTAVVGGTRRAFPKSRVGERNRKKGTDSVAGRKMRRVKDSQTLTGAQLSVIPVEATVPILSCRGSIQGQTTAGHVAQHTHTHTQNSSLINYKPQHIHGTAVSFLSRNKQVKILTVLSQGARSSNPAAVVCLGGGAAFWRTWGIIGAKDGWRQQLLVPRCGSVPEANPLISAQLCKPAGCCPEAAVAAAARTHTHVHSHTALK